MGRVVRGEEGERSFYVFFLRERRKTKGNNDGRKVGLGDKKRERAKRGGGGGGGEKERERDRGREKGR